MSIERARGGLSFHNHRILYSWLLVRFFNFADSKHLVVSLPHQIHRFRCHAFNPRLSKNSLPIKSPHHSLCPLPNPKKPITETTKKKKLMEKSNKSPTTTTTEPLSSAVGAMGSADVDKVFDHIDENGDGKLSASELGKVVRAIEGPHVSEQEVDVMIQEMDADRDGFVDRKEFAAFNKGGERVEADLKDAFDMYDLDSNGLISAKELHLVLQKLGERCGVDECRKMIGKVDSDGDGFVNFQEFMMMMSGGLK